MFQRTARLWLVASVAMYTACFGDEPAQRASAPLILVSVDGLRYDMLDSVPTPNIDRLAQGGVRAPLVPVFPTKTFPNHYSIVTGLYPAQHGIVSNNMFDPEMNARFALSDRQAVGDERWWGGEPIWVGVERQGRVAAPFYWPGSEAPIDGVRPTFWRAYDPSVPYDARVDQVLAWLDLPDAERPVFLSLYFEDVDVRAHEFGPYAVEVGSAIARVDHAVGRLFAGIETRGLAERMNVILVSDHGIAASSRERVIFVDDYVDLAGVDVVDWSPVMQLRPEPEHVESVYRELVGRHPHLKVYRRAEIPERFRYRDHPRIQPIVAIADPGWEITTRHFFNSRPGLFQGGNHGYDHEHESMLAVFVASGPGFEEGVIGEPFQNIHLYELMCQLLNVPPAANAGRLDSTAAFRRREPTEPGDSNR